CNRIEVCLRIVSFKNGREEVIADTRIDCQLGRRAPIILHKNSEDLSVVVDIVDVVDPTTVRLPCEQRRQTTSTSSLRSGIIRELSSEVQGPARRRRLEDRELLRSYLAAK